MPLKTKLPPVPGGATLGRSALLVFLAGAAGTAALMSGVYLSQKFIPDNDKGPAAFGAVGIAVGVGTYCWSITLALRALYFRERVFVPLLVLALATVPWGFYSCVLWANTAFGYPGLTMQDSSWVTCELLVVGISIPILAIGGLMCTALILKILTKRRARRNMPSLTRAQRWKWGMLIVGLCILFWSVTFAPVMSIMSLAGTTRVDNWPIGWLPSLYSDAAILILERAPTRAVSETLSYYRILSCGTASEALLLARISGSDRSAASFAMAGMLKRNRPLALTLAENWIFKTSPSSNWLVYGFSEEQGANKWWPVSKAIEYHNFSGVWPSKYAFRRESNARIPRPIAELLLKSLCEKDPPLQRFAGFFVGRDNYAQESYQLLTRNLMRTRVLPTGPLTADEEEAVKAMIQRLEKLLSDHASSNGYPK